MGRLIDTSLEQIIAGRIGINLNWYSEATRTDYARDIELAQRKISFVEAMDKEGIPIGVALVGNEIPAIDKVPQNIEELTRKSEFTADWIDKKFKTVDKFFVQQSGTPLSLLFMENQFTANTFPYRLLIVMPLGMPSGPVNAASLPPYVTSIGFSYNPLLRGEEKAVLASLEEKRLPREALSRKDSGSSCRRSMVSGKTDDPEGKDMEVQINMCLQDPNPGKFLECYEFEITPKSTFAYTTGEQFHPLTEEIAPESLWQENERHYCALGQNGYQLNPIRTDKISKFVMRMHYHGNSAGGLLSMLGDVPVSVNGSNYWYATGEFGEGELRILYHPQWKAAAIVYEEGYLFKSPKIIRPPSYIRRVSEEMAAVRQTLVENLAKARA